MEHLICTIYRSSSKDECYLYVDKRQGLACLPETLLQLLGKPVEVMTILLKPGLNLARVNVEQVMKALRDQGYFLQLPPPLDPQMQKIHQLNDKIPR